jgi:niacin transporter
MAQKNSFLEDDLRQIPLAALFAALGVTLPQLFHLTGLGAMFLPMYLPVMLGSMLLLRHYALSTAIISPLVSWLLTGMPPLAPPVLPVMLIELSTVSIVISTLRVHHKKSVLTALISAIVIDRLILLIIALLIAPLFGVNSKYFSIALVMSGIPGIILQLIVIPLSIRFIEDKFPQFRYEQ